MESEEERRMAKEVNNLWEEYAANPTEESLSKFSIAQDDLLAYQRSRIWDNIKGTVYA